MLNSISWQEFLLFFLSLICAYYVIATLLLYSRDIITFIRHRLFSRDSTSTIPPPHDYSTGSDIMGVTVFQSHQHHVPREVSSTTDEILAAPLKEPEETIAFSDNHQITLIGTIADLLQDINTLSPITRNSSQEECITLFKTLLAKYSMIPGTEYETMINTFISSTCKENGPADFDVAEIKSWWPKN